MGASVFQAVQRRGNSAAARNELRARIRVDRLHRCRAEKSAELHRVARFLANGTALDGTFGGGSGRVVTQAVASMHNRAYSLALLHNGKILVGAECGSATCGARYNPDGTLDASFATGGVFGPGGTTPYESLSGGLALAFDGSFVLAGWSNPGAGIDSRRAFYYSPAGTLVAGLISPLAGSWYIDGQARGIALARAGQSSGATINEHWMDTERALLSQMRELEPDACAEYLSFVRATIRTNNRLLESSPLPHDNEVTLLAVDRDVHGLGVGTVLLDAAVSHLSSLGATRAHLYTDSNCSWKFYELHGFKRTATHRANREERRHDMPRESFLYELDLTA